MRCGANSRLLVIACLRYLAVQRVTVEYPSPSWLVGNTILPYRRSFPCGRWEHFPGYLFRLRS